MPSNFFFEMTYDKFKKIADYRKAAVATLTYIATRENQQGEEMNRTLFGKERTYQLEEAIAFVNTLQMAQLRLWHVVCSPPLTEEVNKKKDLDLHKIARETMKYLQAHLDQNMEFIVAEHNDHSDIPHVQGLVFVQEWIDRDVLIRMGEIALQGALEQRRSLDRGIDLIPLLQQAQFDLAREQRRKLVAAQNEQYQAYLTNQRQNGHRFIGMAGGRARKARKARQPTLACPDGMMHKVVKVGGKNWCTVDKKFLEQEQGLEL